MPTLANTIQNELKKGSTSIYSFIKATLSMKLLSVTSEILNNSTKNPSLSTDKSFLALLILISSTTNPSILTLETVLKRFCHKLSVREAILTLLVYLWSEKVLQGLLLNQTQCLSLQLMILF